MELATCDLAFFGQPANFPDPNSCFRLLPRLALQRVLKAFCRQVVLCRQQLILNLAPRRPSRFCSQTWEVACLYMGSSVRGFAVDWQWVLAPVFADMQPGMLLLQIGREHSDGQNLAACQQSFAAGCLV